MVLYPVATLLRAALLASYSVGWMITETTNTLVELDNSSSNDLSIPSSNENILLDQIRDTPEQKVTNACRLQGPPGGTGFRNYAGAAKQAAATSVGHMKTGMIFVDFSDVPATETPKSTFDKFMPDAAKWYYDASYGRLNMTMEADTTKWHRMPGISSSYNINRRLTYPIFAKYLNDAAKSASPKFGNIDVLYVTANRAAKAITTSPTYMGPIKYASGQSKRAVMFGNDFYNWGFKELNHETGHTMGLPDLYPLDGSNKPTTFYVGGWDLMGLISGPAPDYFAWHKWLLGWIDDDQVSCITMKGSSQQTISPLHVKGGTKMVAIKLNETTLLGIELRTKGGNDVRTCSEGLVFYTIAVDKGSGRGCLVVHDPRPSKAKECSARGGQLSGAAMDFGKGEKDISLPQLGVTVKVTGNVDGNYQFTINYEGGR